jgi:hypothetical protein
MKRKVVFTGTLLSLLVISALAQTTTVDFEKDKTGGAPAGFTFACG